VRGATATQRIALSVTRPMRAGSPAGGYRHRAAESTAPSNLSSAGGAAGGVRSAVFEVRLLLTTSSLPNRSLVNSNGRTAKPPLPATE
jgi:hypothetical protein